MLIALNYFFNSQIDLEFILYDKFEWMTRQRKLSKNSFSDSRFDKDKRKYNKDNITRKNNFRRNFQKSAKINDGKCVKYGTTMKEK